MYNNILDKDWYSIGKAKQSKSAVLGALTDDVLINLGTDAQCFGKDKINLVTCICVHTPGKGGIVFYHKEYRVDFKNLWDKLYAETMLSLTCASELTELRPELRDNILVHVDANPKPVYASNSYIKQLAGMVMGYGFNYVLKPDAWAASHAADHIVKNKNGK